MIRERSGTRMSNPVLIPCGECITGPGQHKSGHNIFLELVRPNGTVSTYGPAVRQ